MKTENEKVCEHSGLNDCRACEELYCPYWNYEKENWVYDEMPFIPKDETAKNLRKLGVE